MLAPLSEISSVVEKLVPVSVYVSIPFSGVIQYGIMGAREPA